MVQESVPVAKEPNMIIMNTEDRQGIDGLYMLVEVKGVNINFLVDTGCSTTIISRNAYLKVKVQR